LGFTDILAVVEVALAAIVRLELFRTANCREMLDLNRIAKQRSEYGHGAAKLVDQTARGAKPSEILIFEPHKFKLAINLKTSSERSASRPS
jgi:hypothetical protein